MPQIIFEVSDNVIEQDFYSILAEIHQVLTDTLPAKLDSCKSRVIRHKEFLIGDGSEKYAFIHLSIGVIKGRTKETLDLSANKITSILQDNFAESANKFTLKISVAISELPEVYHRVDL
jgi:5-carboxymethyl-2-hydroxymuconate isomerase